MVDTSTPIAECAKGKLQVCRLFVLDSVNSVIACIHAT